MNKTHLRLVSLVTLICFMTTGTAWGAPGIGILAPSISRETPTFLQIDIPQDLASIEEIYEAPAKADPSLVLHIQNLHGNYEAQNQIKKLLDYLYKTYAFKLIFVEGAAEKLNADYLRLFADDDQNRELADYLTHKGQLTGPEFYLVDGPKDIEAVGIEQPDLYRKNLESFRAVYGAKEMIDQKLSSYDAKIDALASSVFTQGARRMISEWRKFESGHRDFLPYVKRLSQEAKKVLGLDLESLFAQVEWPQVTRLLVIQTMEADLNRKAAEEERARLAAFLNQIQVDPEIIEAVKKLGERRISMSRLDANGKENRLENLPRYLLERLVAEAGPKGFYFHDYPAFSLYAGYLILQSELQSQALYDEINLLFEKILAEQTPSEKEKNLLELFRDMELLKKLLHLELTRKEWKRAAYRKEWINPRSIEKRLQDITLAAFSTSLPAPDNSEGSLDTFFDTSLEFYDYARAREGAFYGTIEREMEKNKSEKAVLVTGGFHTEGLMDLFREHGINYGVLLPKILGGVADPENKYSEAMMESGSTLFDLATIEINSILQNPQTYEKQGGNNWERVQSVLDGFLNQGIYRNAEDAFKALNFAGQGIFAKDQGFQFVTLPSRQVLFRITGDRLMETIRAQNQFDMDAEGYLQSRDGKYLIFEVQPVPDKKPGSLKYRISIPRFQNEGENVDKPVPQNSIAADKNLTPQIPPAASAVASQPVLIRSETRSLTSIWQYWFPGPINKAEALLNRTGVLLHASKETGNSILREGLQARIFFKGGNGWRSDPAVFIGQNNPRLEGVQGWRGNMAISIFQDPNLQSKRVYVISEKVKKMPTYEGDETYHEVRMKGDVEGQVLIQPELIEGIMVKIEDKDREISRMQEAGFYLPLYLVASDSQGQLSLVEALSSDEVKQLVSDVNRSELRQDTFNEFFSEHLIPELLGNDVASVRVYYQVEDNKDYLMIEKHGDDGKVGETVKVPVEKEKLVEIFYHLRRRFSIDRGIKPAMDPVTIGLPGRGYTFVKWVDGETESSAVKNAFAGDQGEDEEPNALADLILKKINGPSAKYFKISAVALPARGFVSGFEMVEFTKEEFLDESAYLEERRLYMAWKHVEENMDLKSILKDFAENKLLALKKSANLPQGDSEVEQSRAIREKISAGKFDGLIVIDVHLFGEFLKLFLEKSLGFLESPQHYFPSLVPSQVDLDTDTRERLLYENSLEFIKFAIQYSGVEESLLVGILLTVMRKIQSAQPAGRSAQKFFKTVFGELGGNPTDAQALRSWHAKMQLYNFSKIVEKWEPPARRSETRSASDHVDNVYEVVAAAKKVFNDGHVPQNTKSLLDIGAGRGLMTLFAVERGVNRIVAVDLNRDNLEKLNSKVAELSGKTNYEGNVQALEMDMFDLEVKDETGGRALFNAATIANVIGLSMKNLRYDANKELKGETDKELKRLEMAKREEAFKERLTGMLKRVYDHLEPNGRVVILDRTLDLSGILEGFTRLNASALGAAVNAAENWQAQKDFFEPLLINAGFENVTIHYGSVEEEDMDPSGDLEELVPVNTNFIVTAEKKNSPPAADVVIQARSESRNAAESTELATRESTPKPIKGDEMFRLGRTEINNAGSDPKVLVALNSGAIANDGATLNGILQIFRGRQLKAAASPFDDVVKDLVLKSGIPGIEEFLDEPALVGILTSGVPSEEDLKAVAGLLLLFPQLSFHVIVRSETRSVSPEQTESIKSIKAAKGRDGKAIGTRLIVSLAKRPQAVKQILDRWASKQANEIAGKFSDRDGKNNVAEIQNNLVTLGVKNMFDDLNLVSAKQVHGVEDEGRLARFDIQSLVSAMLSKKSVALLKEMPDVIQQKDPGQNVFEIMRTGINSLSQNLTDAFQKAYKIAVSA